MQQGFQPLEQAIKNFLNARFDANETLPPSALQERMACMSDSNCYPERRSPQWQFKHMTRWPSAVPELIGACCASALDACVSAWAHAIAIAGYLIYSASMLCMICRVTDYSVVAVRASTPIA